jgi:transcriptional regulator with XRE-family HTH domain
MVEEERAIAIGRRVRRLRQERGISLTELARKAGIGKATLSGIETGTRNPSLEKLYAVAGQLGVPLAALLAESPPQDEEGRDPAGAQVSGAAVDAVLLEVFRDGGVTTELYRLRIRPGSVQRSPAHPPGTVEYLTVYAGAARVGPPEAPLEARAGDHVSWAADIPHVYEALDGTEVRAGLLIRQPHAPS